MLLFKDGNWYKIFNLLKEQLANHLISKASLWQEREKAIKERQEQFNNEILPKVAKDANFGCKGGNI